VFREETFSQTSEPVITVGEGDNAFFRTPAPGLGDELEMFERADDGYTIRFTDRVDGKITLAGGRSDGEEYSLQELIDDNQAESVGEVSTQDGMATVYEISVERGGWGLVELGDGQVFFQVQGKPAAVAGRGLAGLDIPVVGMVLLAAIAHLMFLLFAALAYDVNPTLQEKQIPDRFVEFMVDDVDDPLEEEKTKEPQEDTTAKKAGGEEGKFGNPDKKLDESKVPKNDGPMKKKIDVKNVGMNKALDSQMMGSGALKNIFQDQDGFSNKMDVAMSGEGSELQVGRGAGGMGLRGTGSGGGGEGFGRVHGLGSVDTGGGQGTGAKIGTKQKSKVEPKMRSDPPKLGDFCSKSNIQNVVGSKRASIQYCYEKELQTNPKLSGKIVAQWKVALDGSVRSASIASSTMNSSAVEGCITRVIRRMKFAKPDGGICVIKYPFVFTGMK
jgi:hypothetical protein